MKGTDAAATSATGRRASDGRPLTIGLTGPIACGKSTVARMLAARGASIVDADALVREVTQPGGPALSAIAERFGRKYLTADGSLDRSALARHVFTDPDELRALEAIVRPEVRPRISEELARAASSGAPVVVIEAIGLVEGGYADIVDEVWLIRCAEGAQRERLAARGLVADEAARRIAAQAGIEERVRPVASRILDTSGSLEDTEAAVVAALAPALAGAGSRPPSDSGSFVAGSDPAGVGESD